MIDASRCSQRTLTRLPIGELARVDRLRHHAAMLFLRTVAPLCPLWVLDRSLTQAVTGVRKGEREFRVPAPIAQSCHGEQLVLEIAPGAIEWVLHDWLIEDGVRFHVDRFFVGGGDWYALARAMSANPVFAEVVELHRAGLNYRVTDSYSEYVSRMRVGRPVSRNKVLLSTENRIDAYFERFVGLFQSIRERGVVPRSRMARGGSGPTRTPPVSPSEGARIDRTGDGGEDPMRVLPMRRFWSEFVEQDIGVAIGARGELFKLPGGQHRTAIAQVLGLTAIPVQVRMVHHQWLGRLLAETGLPASEALIVGLQHLRDTLSVTNEYAIGLA